ncbi:MAG TPA: hypothetical protein VMC03_05285 [Streptosporangiaceae bacterium]|nr:hypothetical protein [Streptosporangiaceae bacterium]
MSSAILYLAIVAIWACVLVPRWLHRSHDNHSEQEVVSEAEEFAEYTEFAEYGEYGEYGEPGPGADPVAWENPGAAPAEPVAGEPVAGEPVAAEQSNFHVDYSASYSITTLSVETTGADDLDGAVNLGGAAGEDGYVAAYAEASYEAEYNRPGDADSASHDWSPAQDPSPAEGTSSAEGTSPAQEWPATHAGPGPGRQQPRGPSRPPSRSPSRAHVLQARRRLLTMLVALTIGTALCTVTGLMPWWVLIVPIGLVGLYLMLLREVALADAENARRRAEAHARYVRAARAQAMREREAREAAELAASQQTAQVIDLSALAKQLAADQPYDQYADAEIRAVGD